MDMNSGVHAVDTRIRTYKLRRGRLTPGQAAALAFSSVPQVADVDFASLPVGQTVLEVGFGFGEATIELARRQPHVHVIAVDVHTPGIGRLVARCQEHGLTNITVIEGDALLLLQRMPAGHLTGIRAFFPDPWPKARHHKRRLFNNDTLALMASAVTTGGFLHTATDWAHYAQATRALLDARPDWQIAEHHELAVPKERPQTRFERRAITAGRAISDLVAVRR
jgi:tRNA (guanine-N7-)-methyltransferase